MIKCSYGCGNKAHFFFNNGKGCCLPSPNSCEGKRKKDSEKKKGKFLGTPSWEIESFEYKPWNKGLTKETDSRLKIMGENVSKSQRNRDSVLSGKASTPEKEIERKRKEKLRFLDSPKIAKSLKKKTQAMILNKYSH